MINDKLAMKGDVTLVLSSPDKEDQVIEIKNLVVDTGLAYIASRMKDATDSVMSHMAIGSGTTAAAGTDTALGNELARVALTSTTIVTTTVTNDAIQYVATFLPGVGTGAVTEAGTFNASSSGTMLCRTVFAVINKGQFDTLTVTWKITIEP